MHKAVKKMNRQTTTKYNAETLENLINTVHSMYNSTTEIERLFGGELNAAYISYINAPNTQEYTID